MDTSKVQSYDQTTQGTGMRGTQGYEQGNVGTMQDQPTGTTGYGQTAGGMGPGGYGRVILTIKSAHNMNDKAWIGKADPYVTVRIADAEISTHHVKNAGEHATWDESFAFNNVAPTDNIRFDVYDHNRMLKDAHMGEGTLPLRQVFDQGHLDTRVPLSTRTGTKDAGEVWITLRKEDAQGESQYQQGYTQTAMTGTETRGTETRGTETRGTEIRGEGKEAVCGRETFSVVEDRPRVVERVTNILEHRPVEREFVKEVKMVGEKAMQAGQAEHLGTTEAVVSEAQPREACEVLSEGQRAEGKTRYTQETRTQGQTRYEA